MILRSPNGITSEARKEEPSELPTPYKCQTCGSNSKNMCIGVACFTRFMEQRAAERTPEQKRLHELHLKVLDHAIEFRESLDSIGEKGCQKRDQKSLSKAESVTGKGFFLLICAAVMSIALVALSVKMFGFLLGAAVALSVLSPWWWLVYSVRKGLK